MRHRFGGLIAIGLAILSQPIAERVAHACGGCFTPQETPTVVTDHRMVLTIAKDQTTLYDQIRYQGDPKAFAWVLPISGEATVGLSSNVLFNAIDARTQTTVVPPSQGGSSSGGATGASAGAAAEDGVTVTKQEQIGPYETVQLRSTDPKALTTWLGRNGFQIGADLEPIIASYVAQSLDFLAIKLVPGAGVREMRPVRVTTAGAQPSLPLRMVAAGAGATLGITLWVVAEGRYEPQNFPWFRIDDGSLVWDFGASTSNYRALRAAFTKALGGRGWEIESSLFVPKDQLLADVRSLTQPNASRPEEGYAAIEAGVYGAARTPEQAREDDLSTLFGGIPGYLARITRLRADLSRLALGEDLWLQASGDQDVLSNIHQVARTGDASCADCPSTPAPVPAAVPSTPSTTAGTAPRYAGGDTTFACATAASKEPGRAFSWALVALGAALAIRATRRTPLRRRCSSPSRGIPSAAPRCESDAPSSPGDGSEG